MNIYDSQIKYLHDKIFNYPLIEEIDDDLILLSITEPAQKLDNRLNNRLIKKYGSNNNDSLEFLGDAVLELLVTDLLLTKGLTVGKMSQIRQAIVKNVSLICLMNDLKLCNVDKLVTKSCADLFEAFIGAVYTHLKQYDIDSTKIINEWLIKIWNMDYIIEDMINHPNDDNICSSIQRFYEDLILEPPNFDYIKSNYDKLQKIYDYYRLGSVKLFEKSNRNIWNVKVECPLTLGCQYYEDKQGNHVYLSNQFDSDKQLAIEKSCKQAIDVIINDYRLK